MKILKEKAFWASSIETIDIGNVVEMEAGVFYDCDRLRTVALPKSLTIIPEGTFRSCGALESIIIPNSVTDIGNYAFCDCEILPSIRIPQSVRIIGHGAFFFCNNLHDIYMDSPNPPNVSSEILDRHNYKSINLYVPKGSKDRYASTFPWSELNIIEN